MMSNNKSVLLLDTHTWLWYGLKNKQRLKPRHISEIENSADQGTLLISAITIWEIGMLNKKNRITLGMDAEDWIKKALSFPGINLIGLEPEIVLASHTLPGEFHPDPADRILVATARHLDAKLMTADQRIINYGKSGLVRISSLI